VLARHAGYDRSQDSFHPLPVLLGGGAGKTGGIRRGQLDQMPFALREVEKRRLPCWC
jgi:hypothetical protein